jgi:hypothetical protein
MTHETIWKYTLDVVDVQTIKIPKGAEILTVQMQDSFPCLWVLVDPTAHLESRIFEIFGTGNPITSDMGTSRKYIATFQLNEGRLVFHVFENTGI